MVAYRKSDLLTQTIWARLNQRLQPERQKIIFPNNVVAGNGESNSQSRLTPTRLWPSPKPIFAKLIMPPHYKCTHIIHTIKYLPCYMLVYNTRFDPKQCNTFCDARWQQTYQVNPVKYAHAQNYGKQFKLTVFPSCLLDFQSEAVLCVCRGLHYEGNVNSCWSITRGTKAMTRGLEAMTSVKCQAWGANFTQH